MFEVRRRNKNVKIMHSQGFAVPERRGRVLASGKAQGACFGILPDFFGHAQGHLDILPNDTVQSGIDEIRKQEN